MTDDDRSLGKLEGKMDLVISSIAAHHKEAQESRQRMFRELDQQGRVQAVQTERITQLEREVGPMKEALDDYQRMRARAGGIIATVMVAATIAGTVMAHGLSVAVAWIKRTF